MTDAPFGFIPSYASVDPQSYAPILPDSLRDNPSYDMRRYSPGGYEQYLAHLRQELARPFGPDVVAEQRLGKAADDLSTGSRYAGHMFGGASALSALVAAGFAGMGQIPLAYGSAGTGLLNYDIARRAYQDAQSYGERRDALQAREK